MSNYTKTTNFAAKDSLPSGNAAKIVKGAEIDTEFNNIATASATKADIAGPTFTGTVTIPTVDLNGGAIDGTTVGASTAAAITGTTIVANTSINIAGDGATVTGIKDEDDMSSNSATKLATQQSIKAYVDSQVTAQDLDVTDGSTSIDIDLDSESLGILGGTGIDSTASGTGVTLAIDATVATLAGTQTLSNKTLSTPVISGNLTTDGLIDGRDVATDGAKLDGIESGATADQTAAQIKTAYESNADTNAFTDADHSKLDGIEASADVTDTANVTAAGALMDSELTSEASVKALNQGVATTDSPTFAGVTAPVTGNVTGNLTGNVTGNVTGNLTGDVTGDVTGDLTGSVLTAAQTNITSVGTLGSLTVSGDVTVDTNSLKVDSTNNRVGILNASPDVSLDVGSATDAMHVPVGTTAQRPGSPAAGYFRYNSTTGGFEGYTDAWGAIAGGGGGVAPSIDTMTGDGSDTTLALTNAPVNENATFVTIDGVTQHKSTYSVSGTTLTFSTAPPTGSAVEAITLNTTTINTASILQDADGDTKVQVEESSDEDKIRFDIAGTERVIIDNTGVGIGTSSPTGNLEIATSASDAGVDLVLDGNKTSNGGIGSIIFNNNGDSVGMIRSNRASANDAADMLFYTQATGGANTERLRITSAGQTQVVGFDAMTLGFPAVAGGASRSGIKPTVTGAGAGQLQFLVGGDNSTEATTIAATIDSSGNVLAEKTVKAEFFTTTGDSIWFLNDLNATGTSYINYYGYNQGLTQFRNTVIANGKGASIIALDGTTKNSTFSGTLTSLPTYNNGSASSANMVVNSSGVFLRSVSSAKYKRDIEDVQDAYVDSLLNIRPVYYRSTLENDNTEHSHWGFIAEEVAEIDPRLVHYKTVDITYSDDGERVETELETPEPEGVQYDRFAPLMLKLIQKQQATITALEARITQLENN